MSKIRIIVIIGIILLLAENDAFALFDGKYKETLKKLEDTAASYEKLRKEEEELKIKCETIAKENEALKQDRDNLITHVKALMIDKGKFKELEETAAKLESEKRALGEELNKTRQDWAALQNEIKEIQTVQAEIVKERDELKSEYEKSGKEALIKRLQEENSSLEELRGMMWAKLEKLNGNLKYLTEQKSKLEAERELLTIESERYKKDYGEAIKTNRAFEQEIKDMPKKFSELARQNKKLLKETSSMHYNTGVFYTKNKEYDRATTEFEKAIEINPDDASAHFNLGYIYAEYMVDRKKAVEHFRHYLRLAKKNDKDIEWVRKYILTWQTWEGKEPMN